MVRVLVGREPTLMPLCFRPPFFQTSPARTAYVVYFTLFISFAAYARFVTLVIRDITNHLGIACFTVRKKGEDGVWKKC